MFAISLTEGHDLHPCEQVGGRPKCSIWRWFSWDQYRTWCDVQVVIFPFRLCSHLDYGCLCSNCVIHIKTLTVHIHSLTSKLWHSYSELTSELNVQIQVLTSKLLHPYPLSHHFSHLSKCLYLTFGCIDLCFHIKTATFTSKCFPTFCLCFPVINTNAYQPTSLWVE